MKIGLHLYDPLLSRNQSVSSSVSGTLLWTYIIDQYIANGHEVVWFGDGSIEKAPHVRHIDEIDAFLIVWRWAMPEYKERNEAYIRQCNLIANALEAQIPIIIHDEDHKMTPAQIKFFSDEGVILTAPEFFPRDGFETLMFPNPFQSSVRSVPSNRKRGLTYIGNNYERYEQSVEYIGKLKHVNCEMWGNWLIPSAHRETPEQVRKDFPNAIFRGPLAQDEVVDVLSLSKATIHLAKPSYCETGFMTLRWAEAVAAKCIAFVPKEFQLPFELPMQVSADKIESAYISYAFDNEKYAYDLEIQTQFVNKWMRFNPWLKILEKACK